MHKVIILASLVALAASGANCGRSNPAGDMFSPSSILGPSALDGADAGTQARGGGGGGGKPGGGTGGGTGGGGGSLTLVMVTDVNTSGLSWGDHITFNVSTSATSPFVSVNCYQGSTWVYAASVGYFAAYPWAKEFTLAASSWPRSAADCTARLYTTVDGSSSTTLATLPFSVPY